MSLSLPTECRSLGTCRKAGGSVSRHRPGWSFYVDELSKPLSGLDRDDPREMTHRTRDFTRPPRGLQNPVTNSENDLAGTQPFTCAPE